MNKKILVVLVIIATAVVLRGFFMPWAHVRASVTKVAKKLTDAADPLKKAPGTGKVIKDVEKITDLISAFGDVDVKATVRGYDIPRLVNSKTSKVALSLSQVLFKSTKGLDIKSYLVYLLPLIAILCAVLAIMGSKAIQPVVAMLIVSGSVSIGGFYNLLTMDFSNLIVKIAIGKGLWYTMYAYLSIFILGIIWMILDKRSKWEV